MQWEEEEFAHQMVELEMKEEVEWKAQEEEEQRVWEAEAWRLQEVEEWRMWEEEKKELWLASAQEKRWLAELAAQHQQEWMVEGKTGESLQSRNNQREQDGDCWGCHVWEEVCQ